MAAEIKKQKGLDVQLVKGSGGVFDVFRDDQLVFSKHQSGRFPEAPEVVDAL